MVEYQAYFVLYLVNSLEIGVHDLDHSHLGLGVAYIHALHLQPTYPESQVLEQLEHEQ